MSFPPPSPKQARIIWSSMTALAIAVMCVLAGLALWGLGLVLDKLSMVLVPVLAALILAYILDPVVEFFERRKFSRMTSVLMVFVFAVIIMVSALASVIPGVLNESRRLQQNIPRDFATLRGRMDRLGEKFPWLNRLYAEYSSIEHRTTVPATNSPPEIGPFNPPANTNSFVNETALEPAQEPHPPAGGIGESMDEILLPGLKQAALRAAKWLTQMFGAITSWMEFLLGLIFVPVFLFYFLLEKHAICEHWTDYLPLKKSAVKDELVFALKAVNDCLIVFFRGQVLVALCVGSLLTAGFLLMGLNYAVLLGLVAAVLGIVPYLGTFTTLLLALAVAGVQFGDWTHPLLVIGIVAAVKLLEDFLISPRIIGERAGLSPVTIIIAVMVGTTLLGGFVGAMLAIPITGALRTLMFRHIWTGDHHGKKQENSPETSTKTNSG
jgi:predicted PurR-regulated permease PerM